MDKDDLVSSEAVPAPPTPLPACARVGAGLLAAANLFFIGDSIWRGGWRTDLFAMDSPLVLIAITGCCMGVLANLVWAWRILVVALAAMLACVFSWCFATPSWETIFFSSFSLLWLGPPILLLILGRPGRSREMQRSGRD